MIKLFERNISTYCILTIKLGRLSLWFYIPTRMLRSGWKLGVEMRDYTDAVSIEISLLFLALDIMIDYGQRLRKNRA